MQSARARDLVDLERYPLHAPDSARYAEIVQEARAALGRQGCAVLPALLRGDAFANVREDGRALAPLAHVNDILTNPYSTVDDPSLPAEHPIRHFMERNNAFVPKAASPPHNALRSLYEDPTFQRFVAACLDQPTIHEYADPLAGLVLNVLRPGCQHPWHYDTNEFIVSTLLEPAEAGGIFEYCPDIRAPGDERYDAVGRVLRGEDRAPVRVLELRPGDLQLFEGRFALHRVTRVGGSRARITAIFAYAARPGVIGKPERTRQLFGRVTPAHLAAAARSRQRADGLVD